MIWKETVMALGPSENNVKSFRITGVLVEIQTEHLSNTSLGTRLPCSGLQRLVARKQPSVPQEHIDSIFRVEKYGKDEASRSRLLPQTGTSNRAKGYRVIF
jgi:hypothetical protein